jgi:hypothetical protein
MIFNKNLTATVNHTLQFKNAILRVFNKLTANTRTLSQLKNCLLNPLLTMRHIILKASTALVMASLLALHNQLTLLSLKELQILLPHFRPGSPSQLYP